MFGDWRGFIDEDWMFLKVMGIVYLFVIFGLYFVFVGGVVLICV